MLTILILKNFNPPKHLTHKYLDTPKFDCQIFALQISTPLNPLVTNPEPIRKPPGILFGGGNWDVAAGAAVLTFYHVLLCFSQFWSFTYHNFLIQLFSIVNSAS